MRRLKRSLVAKGRSSVCGKGVPSAASKAGSSASALAALGGAATLPAAETLATAGEDAAEAVALGADAATSGAFGSGAGAETATPGATEGAGSPRQWLEKTTKSIRPKCMHRSRMRSPSILESGERRLFVERHNPSASQAAYERFIRIEHLPGLDGLRCMAILPVIWHHATPRLLPGVLGKGAVGVDLFFALSGFLITTLLLRERRQSGRVRLGAFYARRSLRIFPLYYVVLAFYVLRALQTQTTSVVARHFLHSLPFHATYTANWFVDYTAPHPVMFAFSWSLCVEEQFYWVWPGLVALFRRRTLLAGLMAAAVCVDTLAEHAAFAAYLPPGSLGLRVLTSFATPIGCGSLVALLLDAPLGFRLANWVLGSRWSAPCSLLLAVGCLMLPATPYLSLSVCLAALVGAVSLRADNGLSWLLELGPVRRIGRLSYAVYLLHVTALGLVRRFLPQLQESALAVFALGLPISLGFAEAAHWAIEKPFLSLRSRFRPPASLVHPPPNP
jgi:peptidoglycan/LPS O-acetylase OafA/YrhL